MSPKHFLLILLLLMGPLWTSCNRKNPLPENFDELLSEWFLNPRTGKLDTLLSYDFGESAFDSTLGKIRAEHGIAGIYSNSLIDSLGTSYVVGFKTPKRILSDTLYPLIIYLHGGIGTTRNDKGKEAFRMLDPLADSIDLFLASPSANRFSAWWTPIGLSRILQTIRFMSLKYPIDPDRILLAGVSDGAAGCYAAASTIPGPFAGFIPIAGSGFILQRIGYPLFPQNLMQRPIYNVYAGKDQLNPLPETRRFFQRLQRAGVDIETSFYPQEGHDVDYLEQELPALTQRVQNWRKPDKRCGLSWLFAPAFVQRPTGILDWATFVANEKAHPYVFGNWDADTLELRSGGVEYIAPLYDSTCIDQDVFWVRHNGDTPGEYRFKRLSTRQILINMIRESVPVWRDELFSAQVILGKQ